VRYQVMITKTADGKQEYTQIIAADQFSTNIVLIGKFVVKDLREPERGAERSGSWSAKLRTISFVNVFGLSGRR
jgi:hypothetical protein